MSKDFSTACYPKKQTLKKLIPFTSTVTNKDCAYHASWFPTATGTFRVKAQFNGNQQYALNWDTKNISVVKDENTNLFFAEKTIPAQYPLTYKSTSLPTQQADTNQASLNFPSRTEWLFLPLTLILICTRTILFTRRINRKHIS